MTAASSRGRWTCRVRAFLKLLPARRHQQLEATAQPKEFRFDPLTELRQNIYQPSQQGLMSPGRYTLFRCPFDLLTMGDALRARWPVLAHYRPDTLRFVKSVALGDVIQRRLACNRKADKPARGAQALHEGWPGM